MKCNAWAFGLFLVLLFGTPRAQGEIGLDVPPANEPPAEPVPTPDSPPSDVPANSETPAPPLLPPMTDPRNPALHGVARRGEVSAFDFSSEPNRRRNYLWSPLVSLVLPGFDQWWEGQSNSAFVYTGVAVGGLVYAASAVQDVKAPAKVDAEEEDAGIDTKGVAERKVLLGLQTVQASGGMSAYHSFRSAVRTRKGQFEFLQYEESPADIMMAPFNYKFLARKTTYIPLGIGLSVAVLTTLALDQDKEDDMRRSRFTGSDAFFTSSLSYNAGTHEEAVFRGWLMPVIMEWTGSETVSAIGSAAVFAAAHLSSNPRPLPQFALGWYWGYLSQKNHWTLSEGIFNHVWWDVIFFATSYQFEKIKKSDKPNTSTGMRVGQSGLDLQPAIWLPPFVMPL